METLYLEVTKDELELPVAVADDVHQLARMCNTTANTILSSIAHEKEGKFRSRYKRVVIDGKE